MENSDELRKHQPIEPTKDSIKKGYNNKRNSYLQEGVIKIGFQKQFFFLIRKGQSNSIVRHITTSHCVKIQQHITFFILFLFFYLKHKFLYPNNLNHAQDKDFFISSTNKCVDESFTYLII
ncbi:MAG: hypothetical protein FD155_2678 [Bacteroidetes bacterium]|nr:MAG: hypothetical protein FD155_2678 [Bacteroidota bacterium]